MESKNQPGEDKIVYSGPIYQSVKIEENGEIIGSEEVPNPVAVRHAWADNPEGANLYNLEGIPASPFRTDEY